MRFESVLANAFGPFRNQKLDLAPSFNIVCGPNETGKSCWHMALYAGLCGMRRAKGPPRVEDREFHDRYRPWDSDGWQVGAVIRLDDGRRVELRHDLDGRVDSSARDADLGRDYSDEIIHDGAPDGSHWLGLDRRSFLATACVRQAELLGLLENAAYLQEYLQRAATATHAETTVAEALTRIEEFFREQVGTTWATTRPLRKALDGVEQARRTLDQARRQHEEYEGVLDEADRLEQVAHGAREELHIFEAAQAQRDAQLWQRRLERAEELSERFPEGPPPDLVTDDALAQLVASALELWSKQPPPIELLGQNATELQQELATLPKMPEGDLEPASDLVAAAKAYRDAAQAVQMHEAMRPVQRTGQDLPPVSPDELKSLAHSLEAPDVDVDPDLSGQIQVIQKRIGELKASKKGARKFIWAGVALIGLGLIAGTQFQPAFLLAVAGVSALIFGLTRGRGSALANALEELRSAENQLGKVKFAAEQVQENRRRAAERALQLGLPAQPDWLFKLAAELEQQESTRGTLERWTERDQTLRRTARQADEAFRRTLAQHGLPTEAELLASYDIYVAACQERADLARKAQGRGRLHDLVTQREAIERAALEAERQRALAKQRLEQAGAACALSGATEQELAEKLMNWQRQRVAGLGAQSQVREDWTMLQALLDHRSLADLERDATTRQDTAVALSEGLDSSAIASVVFEDDINAQLQGLKDAADFAAEQANLIRGQFQEQAGRLGSVAEAEEALGAAEAELGRVRQLERGLNVTREFLERAQERVHRDIAPVLTATIRPWLPRITAGRYTDVTVDPQTLDVQIRAQDGPWRRATLLSHGTAEQIYLLLRMAMAKHLTGPHEVCPLVLDEVTAHCDAVRKQEILKLLHDLSQERQVILFSQEIEVLRWAIDNLTDSQDRLIRLDPALIPA